MTLRNTFRKQVDHLPDGSIFINDMKGEMGQLAQGDPFLFVRIVRTPVQNLQVVVKTLKEFNCQDCSKRIYRIHLIIRRLRALE